MHTTLPLTRTDLACPAFADLPGAASAGDDAIHGCECALPFLTGAGWPDSTLHEHDAPGAHGARAHVDER